MAFVGNVNVELNGLGFASVLFNLKQTMLENGWELMAAGTGSPGKGATTLIPDAGQPGLPNTGSGGGGGVWTTNETFRRFSGPGSSGVVVIYYPTSSSIVATGGTLEEIVHNDTAYRVHRFTTSGDFNISAGSGSVEYLIVGGGGGGGGYGGGSGGEVKEGTVSASSGNYPVVVGSGGPSGISAAQNHGVAGAASSALGVTAAGGAGGLNEYGTGGYRLGPGGDGAGGDSTDMNGGPGLPVTIGGITTYYAAGGGGAGYTVAPGKGGIQGVLVFNPNGSALAVEKDPLNTVESCAFENAWFRIREPEHDSQEESRREFVFLLGESKEKILIKYSRASGFTEGGGPATAPSTGVGGDGIVVSDSTSLDTDAINSEYAALFSNVLSAKYLHIVLDDVNIYGANGGFPFWIWTSRQATGFSDWAMVHENVAPGTTSSLDQDPTYRVCTGILANFMIVTGVRGNWWEAYGLDNSTIKRSESVRFCHQVHALSWTTAAKRFVPSPEVKGFSPYEGQVIFYPMMIGIPDSLFKGYSTGVTCSGFTQHNALDVFKINTNNPRILVYLDPNQRDSVFFPWLPNELPLIE